MLHLKAGQFPITKADGAAARPGGGYPCSAPRQSGGWRWRRRWRGVDMGESAVYQKNDKQKQNPQGCFQTICLSLHDDNLQSGDKFYQGITGLYVLV